jgi:hypothetical protein
MKKYTFNNYNLEFENPIEGQLIDFNKIDEKLPILFALHTQLVSYTCSIEDNDENIELKKFAGNTLEGLKNLKVNDSDDAILKEKAKDMKDVKIIHLSTIKTKNGKAELYSINAVNSKQLHLYVAIKNYVICIAANLDREKVSNDADKKLDIVEKLIALADGLKYMDLKN